MWHWLLWLLCSLDVAGTVPTQSLLGTAPGGAAIFVGLTSPAADVIPQGAGLGRALTSPSSGLVVLYSTFVTEVVTTSNGDITHQGATVTEASTTSDSRVDVTSHNAVAKGVTSSSIDIREIARQRARSFHNTTCWYESGWALVGRDWGCCGSYDGCCVFATSLCYLHDALCRCCRLGRLVCGPLCRPDPDCKATTDVTDVTATDDVTALHDVTLHGRTADPGAPEDLDVSVPRILTAVYGLRMAPDDVTAVTESAGVSGDAASSSSEDHGERGTIPHGSEADEIDSEAVSGKMTAPDNRVTKDPKMAILTYYAGGDNVDLSPLAPAKNGLEALSAPDGAAAKNNIIATVSPRTVRTNGMAGYKLSKHWLRVRGFLKELHDIRAAGPSKLPTTTGTEGVKNWIHVKGFPATSSSTVNPHDVMQADTVMEGSGGGVEEKRGWWW